MIDDWDYQRQLKKGQTDEVDAREHTDAINGMQVNQAALDQEALKGENKKTKPRKEISSGDMYVISTNSRFTISFSTYEQPRYSNPESREFFHRIFHLFTL